jgi:hypothetical protein
MTAIIREDADLFPQAYLPPAVLNRPCLVGASRSLNGDRDSVGLNAPDV